MDETCLHFNFPVLGSIISNLVKTGLHRLTIEVMDITTADGTPAEKCFI